MEQQIKAYIEKYHMIDRGDKVLVGLSGGADSVCLLFVLLNLRAELGIELEAVHVHHGLRGKSADEDEAYVRDLCRQQNVVLHVHRADIRAYALERGLGEEEAGREVRRQVFTELLKEREGSKIALAHHKNDNAETLIWNLCRGCGLKGAGGIAPAEGVWIRPLLAVSRLEIESYLEKRGISYCTDETNKEDTYTRNRIRSHVIPYLEHAVNRQTVEHMAKAMEQFRAAEEYLEAETEKYLEKCFQGGCLHKSIYECVPEALKSRVVYQVLCRMAGKSRDIEVVHVEMVQELMEKQVGRRVLLPYQLEAVRCYEGIRVEKGGKKIQGKETQLDAYEEMSESLMSERVSMRVFERTPDMTRFPEKEYTKWFDYDIIKNTVKIRRRKPGDSLAVNRMGGRQKLKQYFINEKIPKEERDRVWLVADGSKIMWVVGYRQSQDYQITEHTKNILEITFYGGKEDGRER